MHNKQQVQNSLSHTISGAALTMLAMAVAFALTVILTQPAAEAQTFKVIHNFSGADGAIPQAGLIMDAAGNLYGTTYDGGSRDYGTAFRLSSKGSGWILTPLYSFQGGRDGQNPSARLIFGADGSLYGTTSATEGSECGYSGCGTVFKLTPPTHVPPNVLGGWAETVLYLFSESAGYSPWGDVVFDQAGNLYGTTHFGGVDDFCGVVFKLTRSGDTWTESILHSFVDSGDGCQPTAGLTFDRAGNLYGVTALTIFQLTPEGTTWSLNTLYDDPNVPFGGLILDQLGNLYGTDTFGTDGGGTVFMLSPSGGSWTYTVLYSLPGTGSVYGPVDRLAIDAAGNLYGTTLQTGAYGNGSVFKLTPSSGGWTYTDLYDFTGGPDGGWAFGPVLDPNGNLFGTAGFGGANGDGVVWEITP